MPEDIVIPDKPAFKAAEVCELLKVPPYVLKSWENEFKDLGVSKAAAGPRVYRREDVARAVRIRHLVLNEGLTLAGVRRKLEEESGAASAEDVLIAEIAAAASPRPPQGVARAAAIDEAAGQWRGRVEWLRDGLREILDVLSRPVPGAPQSAPVVTAAASSVAPVPLAAERRRVPRVQAAAAPADSPEPPPEPPARELVVEPEPVEPSLFAEGDVEPAVDAPRPGEASPRGRRKSGGRGVSH